MTQEQLLLPLRCLQVVECSDQSSDGKKDEACSQKRTKCPRNGDSKGGHIVRFDDGQRKKDFGQTLREIRVSRGFDQKRASKILGVSRRNLRRWENGHSVPTKTTQQGAIRALKGIPQEPSRSKVISAERRHHIAWEKGRGWFMRVTIIWSSKSVGKRIKVRLKTRDLEEAIKRRDVVLAGYKAMGFSTGVKGELTIRPKG